MNRATTYTYNIRAYISIMHESYILTGILQSGTCEHYNWQVFSRKTTPVTVSMKSPDMDMHNTINVLSDEHKTLVRVSLL